MKISVRWVQLVLISALLSACGGPEVKRHVLVVDHAARTTVPEPGKALVYFVRTAQHAFAVPSAIFDDGQYVGSIYLEIDRRHGGAKKSFIAHQARPGKHTFMVQGGDNVDFLPAELRAGKTYYVLVRTIWPGRFYLTAQDGSLPQAEINETINHGVQLKPTALGQQWAQDNAGKIAQKKTDWWPKWQARPANERSQIKAEHGR